MASRVASAPPLGNSYTSRQFLTEFKGWSKDYLDFAAPKMEKEIRDVSLSFSTAYSVVIRFFSITSFVQLSDGYSRSRASYDLIKKITPIPEPGSGQTLSRQEQMEKYFEATLKQVALERCHLNLYYYDQAIEKLGVGILLGLGMFLKGETTLLARIGFCYYMAIGTSLALYSFTKTIGLWNIVQKKELFLAMDVENLRSLLTEYNTPQ